MSQINAGDFDINPATTTGPDLANRLNRFANAYLSGSFGASASPAAMPGMIWMRDDGSDAMTLMARSGGTKANVPLLSVNKSGTVTFVNTLTTTQIDNRIAAAENRVAGSYISGLTAGAGLASSGTGGSITIQHDNTSSQGSAVNAGSNLIQSIRLDQFGHVTSLSSFNLEDRFYTQGQSNARFLRADTDTATVGKVDAVRFTATADGSNATPAFRLGGMTNTGMFWNAPKSQIRFSINGTLEGVLEAGPNLTEKTSIVTVEGGDTRYARLGLEAFDSGVRVTTVPSPALNTVYTRTKLTFVAVTINQGSNPNTRLEVMDDRGTWKTLAITSQSGDQTLSAIIPADSKFRLTSTGTPTINSWIEVR